MTIDEKFAKIFLTIDILFVNILTIDATIDEICDNMIIIETRTTIKQENFVTIDEIFAKNFLIIDKMFEIVDDLIIRDAFLHNILKIENF